jgi:putative ABC transport system substrate-binding protein
MKRKIAAIFAADIAGYSRLVAEDEEETLRRLASYRFRIRGWRMRRRTFIGLLGCFVIAWTNSTRAQQTRRLPRVVYIDAQTRSPLVDGLLNGLRDLGYIDGSNIRLVKQEVTAPSIEATRAAILDALPNTDILVVGGTVGGVAAKSVPSSIPVVFMSVGAPVDIGLVENLSHPGGNMTGVTFEATRKPMRNGSKSLKRLCRTYPA